MNGFRQARYVLINAWCGLVLCCCEAAERPGEAAAGGTPPPQARVGNVGVLAVTTEAAGSNWRLLNPGDALPERGRLRCNLTPSTIELPGATVQLAAEAELSWDTGKREISLEAGRILLKAAGTDSTWTINAQGTKLRLASGSAVEATVAPQQRLAVHVIIGSVNSGDEKEQKQVGAGNTVTIDANTSTRTETKLTDADRKRIEASLAAARPAQGLGQLMITDAQADSPVRLNIARYHAHVVLQPPVALVQIDQSFYNPYGRQEEGTFIFNLPRGASISRFAMYVTPTSLVEGELIERQQASQVYETIVRQRRDPAILEQIGDNLFKMRVFPIFAKDTKRILLDYTVPLESTAGQCNFRLPLLSDRQPVWDFGITGTIAGPIVPGSAASQSHPDLVFQPGKDDKATFEFHEENYKPTTDFSMSFREKAGNEVALRSYRAEPLPPVTTPAGGTRSSIELAEAARPRLYFLATIEPPARKEPPAEPPPTDVLVLADTSSGMRRCALVRQAVRMVVQNLRREDRFRVMAVDVSARAVHDGWCAAGSAQAAAAMTAFNREFCLGGTDLGESFRQALGSFEEKAKNRRRLVIYVGDGEDTVGDGEDTVQNSGADNRTSALAATFHKAGVPLISVVARRDAPIGYLLEPLARSTGGLVFDVAGNSGAQREFFAWLLAGMPMPERIVKVEVDGATEEDLYCPPSWTVGQPLTVLGRTANTDRAVLKVTTIRDGKPVIVTKELAVDTKRDDVFLGRLWAQRKLNQLRESPSMQDQETRRRITALSQEWSLLSPYTAFLVLESDQEYAQWNINRQQRRRYWKPADSQKASPLSEHWVNLAQLDAQRQQDVIDKTRLARVLRDARAALDDGHVTLAHELLQSQRKSDVAKKSSEYGDLSKRAMAAASRETLSKSLGLQRALFDPAARFALNERGSSVTGLVGATSGIAPEFLRMHPYAAKLLQQVQVVSTPPETKVQDGQAEQIRPAPRARPNRNKPRSKRPSNPPPSEPNPFDGEDAGNPFTAVSAEVNADASDSESRPTPKTAKPAKAIKPSNWKVERPDIEGLVRMLKEQTGGNVMLDQKALDEMNISPNSELSVVGYGRMSLLNYVRFVLSQKPLVLIEEPNRLLITTPERAEVRMVTEVYPVADLLVGNKVASLPLLAEPYLDCEEAARARIRDKLQRPVTVKFEKKPLSEVIEHFAKLLGDTVLVDKRSLDEMNVGDDTPVDADWHDVPAKDTLRWILDKVGLEYVVDREALVITSPERADSMSRVRLHSGCGIVLESPAPNPDEQLQQQQMWGMGGGMGMGGMGGGMGGMGMSMGGSGSMGGGGGGMSGNFGGGRSSPTPLAPSALPLSEGGYSQDINESIGPDEEPEPDEDAPSQSRARPINRRFQRNGSWQPSRPATVQYDIDSVIDLTMSTVRPTTWDTVGGPSSLTFFESSLDLVINTTDQVHEEIEALFERLRAIGVPDRSARGVTVATKPAQRSDNPDDADSDSIIDVITSTVMPTSWNTVGGPGSVAPEPSRTALVFSQTREVHDEVNRLLTMLRRRRYELLRNERPWATNTTLRRASLLEPSATEDWVGPQLSQLREPDAATLALLDKVRREPAEGTWSRLGDGLDSADITNVIWNGPRMEFRIGARAVRVDGIESAIADRNLDLVELGNWGEALRQITDSRFPWMPHRSNKDLAMMFHVEPLGDEQKQQPDENQPKTTRVRLVPRGMSADSGAWLELCFGKSDGLTASCDMCWQGKRTGRVQFPKPEKDDPQARIAVIEDATGRPLGRWAAKVRLTSVPANGPRPAETTRDQIPAIDQGWDDFTVWDRRGQQPTEGSLAMAVNALWGQDWDRAAAQLEAIDKRQPHRPLVLLLKVWCHEHDRSLGSDEKTLALLREVAASGRTGLVEFIGGGNLTWLTPAQRYEILKLQPAASRTTVNLDQLARSAVANGRLDEATDYVTAALAVKTDDGRRFGRWRTKIEILFQRNLPDEAQKAVVTWEAEARPPVDHVADMARILAEHDKKQQANELLTRALAPTELAARDRYRLLSARADMQKWMTRWRTLLDAAALMPVASPERKAALSTLLAELAQPDQDEAAARLAVVTTDADLKRQLLLKQAKLTEDPKVCSQIAWKLFQAGQLAGQEFGWACSAWNRTGGADRTIRFCEDRLRVGKVLHAAEIVELEAAYLMSDRPNDLTRVRSSDPVLQKPSMRGNGDGMGGSGGGMGMF